MRFGRMEIQACGENNFTMKALGLLAFRQDLRIRLVEKLAGAGAISEADGDVNILFFSRIGENFLREAIEREGAAPKGEFEARINRLSGLPEDFRWHRKPDRHLSQPAKWRRQHKLQMLESNGKAGDRELHARLDELQKCLNTEPDLVLQWGRKLALVEIKVLSGEGENQIDRQIRLGKLLCDLLGWEPLNFMIGPEHGGQPEQKDCHFFSWETVAHWFEDVPEIETYLRSFAFYYKGSWQSMLSSRAESPGPTLYDEMLGQFAQQPRPSEPAPPGKAPNLDPGSDPWHFSHLGSGYFKDVFIMCKHHRFHPIRIWTGKVGRPYIERLENPRVNPNWMAEDADGNTLVDSVSNPSKPFSKARMKWVSVQEIRGWPDWSDAFHPD